MSIDYCKLHAYKKIDPLAGPLLAPTLDNSYVRLKTYTDDANIRQHELKTEDLKLGSELISGYAGYIPRKCFYYGKGYVPETKSCISEFENFQRVDRAGKHDPKYVFPDKSLLPDEPKIPDMRPFQLNPNTDVPKHISFPSPSVSDGKSLTEMGDLNPEKTHIKDYTGYIPGKRYTFGATNDVTANRGFIDMSSHLRELKLVNERPTLRDWYVGRAMRRSEKVRLQGFHLETPKKVEPPIGYTGYLPGFRQAGSVGYSTYSNDFFNQRDLKYSTSIGCEPTVCKLV